MKKPIVPAGVRQVLMRFARRRYLAAGGIGVPSSFPVATLVSFIAGKPMKQREAWNWLLTAYSPGNRDLPSIPRRGEKPRSDSFYDSADWRTVRFEALRLSSGACVLCGRSNRQHGVVLHVDHIKPRSLRPDLALTLSNLQVLCEDCNLGKSNRDDTDWRGEPPA